MKYKKIIYFFIINIIIFLSACNKTIPQEKLYVYNWGLYIDEKTIELFEKEYNIKVIYDMFDTNEEMYAKLKSNNEIYDVLCPSDYMIEKLIKEEKLYSFDITKLQNYKYLDKKCLELMQSFDNNNSYAIPYVYSTIGIIYNKKILSEKGLSYPTKWSDLFLEKYKNEIILQDAVRDLIMVGLKKNEFSMNTININELKKAEEDLINQKPLIYAYLIDAARDKMVLGEAAISSMYSGEVSYIKEEGKKNGFEYEYILPLEGANLTFDCWCIPKNANNKRNAIKWIDFMTRPDIAKINYEYMHYGVPNTKVYNSIDDKEKEDKNIFPNLYDNKLEIYKDLGDMEEEYNNIYKNIKSK
ncbi:MAG: ABC transporter substrate-binding protein [Eubacteriales bacterium]|nr:ABC transporter substrate-binding protein [Eubacteriales bacterium]